MHILSALRPLCTQSEDAVLIDVRSDEVRQSNGVPALDRGALGKGVAVPWRPLPTAVARRYVVTVHYCCTLWMSCFHVW